MASAAAATMHQRKYLLLSFRRSTDLQEATIMKRAVLYACVSTDAQQKERESAASVSQEISASLTGVSQEQITTLLERFARKLGEAASGTGAAALLGSGSATLEVTWGQFAQEKNRGLTTLLDFPTIQTDANCGITTERTGGNNERRVHSHQSKAT
jgi:hypothetical protein